MWKATWIIRFEIQIEDYGWKFPSVLQKILLEFQNVCECIYSDKEISMVIYIVLNQTKFTLRKGVFDISVFPLGKDFDMKIG